MPIDTSKVAGRRTLHFAALSDLLAHADLIASADTAGTLRRLGNWTTGQCLGHVAFWINAGYEGYPFKPSWLLRLFGPLFKSHFINGRLRPGTHIPNAPGGTYGTDLIPTDIALQSLHVAVARLQTAPPAKPNPVFGKLTHEQWIALHLRHAEVHFGFFLPT
jgi:hypothetical protein